MWQVACGLPGLLAQRHCISWIDDDCFCDSEPSALQALFRQSHKFTLPAEALRSAQVY